MTDITVEVVAAPAIEVSVTQAGAPGMSAYQLAYANDPSIGTLEEWLDSLGGGGGGAWGGITGTLASQTDLQAALDAKSATGHSHAQSDVTGLTAALTAKADAAAVTTALAGKSDTGHSHVQADVTGLTAALAANATAAALATAAGSANNPHTNAATARNASLPKNFWQTATEPTNWVDGDEWIVNS